jgi:hypothetical protein
MQELKRTFKSLEDKNMLYVQQIVDLESVSFGIGMSLGWNENGSLYWNENESMGWNENESGDDLFYRNFTNFQQPKNNWIHRRKKSIL